MRTGMEMAVLGVAAGLGSAASAQTVFTFDGGTFLFEKAAFADAADPVNWDVLTGGVAITRGEVQGLYNPLQESAYGGIGSPSPLGTLWATGSAADWESLTFMTWYDWAIGLGGPPSTVGVDAVLYLVAEDIYLDIRFESWGQTAGAGGAFSYTRAVIPAPGAGVVLAGGAAFGARRRRKRA